MSLKRRLSKLEKAWYTLEADYYGAHWSELYEQDSASEAWARMSLEQMICRMIESHQTKREPFCRFTQNVVEVTA